MLVDDAVSFHARDVSLFGKRKKETCLTFIREENKGVQ
jgi:hypothetical protein